MALYATQALHMTGLRGVVRTGLFPSITRHLRSKQGGMRLLKIEMTLARWKYRASPQRELL